MKLAPSSVGAEPKKLALLGAILAIGGIVYWLQNRGDDSVSANVAPKMLSDLVHLGNAGELAKAADIQVKMASLHRTLFVEPSPIPVKAALHMMGKCSDEIRLPLLPAAASTRDRLRRDLTALGLL